MCYQSAICWCESDIAASESLNIYEYIFKECVCAGEIFESVCLIFIVFTQNL